MYLSTMWRRSLETVLIPRLRYVSKMDIDIEKSEERNKKRIDK